MEQRQNSFIRKKRIASKRLFLGVAKFDYYYYSRRIDDKRHSRSMRRSNWSMRDWMAANGNWKLWFLHGAPRLILPPRLSQKRRGGDGRNGIAVKSSFLPKRRAYRSLGVTTNRDPSARSLSLSLSPLLLLSIFHVRETNHRLFTIRSPGTRITFAIPRFLGTETKRSCREIRSEILLSCLVFANCSESICLANFLQ